MQIRFVRTALADVQQDIARHLSSLPGPTDEFLEEHVRGSQHYLISAAGARVGFAAIHAGNLITQFSLEPAHRRLGQLAFQQLRKLEYVAAAYVPTCDEYFLAHALDDYRQLLKQAYFFEARASSLAAGLEQYSLRPAAAADEATIREQSGDLFGDVARRIEQRELFWTYRAEARVGLGVLARSLFQPAVASIGMFTCEPFRNAGVAAATITLLIDECSKRQLRAVAGCWYHNHASKRTLERAGMVTGTRLLRVEY